MTVCKRIGGMAADTGTAGVCLALHRLCGLGGLPRGERHHGGDLGGGHCQQCHHPALRGAKSKNETLSMEAKPTHEDSDPVEIIVVVDDSVAKPAAQAQVKSLLQKQEKAAATMSRAIGETVEPAASVYDAAQRLLRHCDLRPV